MEISNNKNFDIEFYYDSNGESDVYIFLKKLEKKAENYYINKNKEI